MNNRKIVHDFILLELVADNDIVSLEDNDQLIELGYIDSMGVMKLIVFLEDTFNIQLDADDIIPENFESIETILSLLTKVIE